MKTILIFLQLAIAATLVASENIPPGPQKTPPGTFPCHDLLAVMAAAEQPVITGVETWPLAVDTGGSAAWGATVPDRRPVPESTLGTFTPWRIALTCDPGPFRAAVQRLFST